MMMAKDNLQEFAKRLRYFLYSRNISVEQFARKLGYEGTDKVQQALNAETRDLTDLIFKMAMHFEDVNFNFLIKGTRLTDWDGMHPDKLQSKQFRK